MTTTYNVVSASLTDDVVTLGLVMVGGLYTGYPVQIEGLGAPYDGNHSLTGVDIPTNTVTFAKNHANETETDVWGILTVTVTWVDTTDVTNFLGVAPAETVDEDYLEMAVDAANVWCYERRQAAGYVDLPSVAPSKRAKLGTILKAGELYRARGSVDAFASFQGLEGVQPVATSVEVLRLLGINRPAVA